MTAFSCKLSTLPFCSPSLLSTHLFLFPAVKHLEQLEHYYTTFTDACVDFSQLPTLPAEIAPDLARAAVGAEMKTIVLEFGYVYILLQSCLLLRFCSNVKQSAKQKLTIQTLYVRALI